MLKELDSVWTILRILGKTEIEEIEEFFGVGRFIFDSWESLGNDKKECFGRREIHVGWETFKTFTHHDTERPDINLWTIVEPLNDLWGHPIGSTNNGVAFSLLRGKLSSKAEIGEFDLSFFADKDVVAFDVSMKAMERVNIRERLERFKTQIGDFSLTQNKRRKLLQHLGKTTACHVLEYNPYIVGMEISLEITHDVGVLGRFLNVNFCNQMFDIFLSNNHFFESNIRVGTGVKSAPHFTKCTLTNHGLKLKMHQWIFHFNETFKRRWFFTFGWRSIKYWPIVGKNSFLKVNDCFHLLWIRLDITHRDTRALQKASPISRYAFVDACLRIHTHVVQVLDIGGTSDRSVNRLL
mmetsp:Transcript_1760/g.2471  ORF Transcript_1760/g.2471 Transcript_1760/m.2471 type:complete len:352 (-) Transcript_1760:391-1446(-)